MTRRTSAGALALLLALASCQPAPLTMPSGAPSSLGPAPTAAVGTAAPGANGALADALRDAISADDILADLGRLDAIASANGGNRATGSAGHDQSVDLVADELRAAGYDVRLDPAPLTAFRQDAPSVLEIQAPGAAALADIRDFKAMLLSPSGDVTAQLFALGFDPAAQPGARNGIGCDPAEWSSVPAGVVALVQPGGCRRRDVILNAQAAGVVGLITSYAEWTPDHVLRPTLIDPEGLSIPAVGVTGSAGLALLAAAQEGAKVHLAVLTTVESTQSPNVIADLPGGDPAHVVMIGGHLDSVIDGPGINDNGSGTMTILEIARELAKLRPDGAAWHVRVAFWTGEEIGLLGSFAYVGGLSAEDASTIEAYLNFDMVGSANGVREIYDSVASSRPIAGKVIEGLLAQALNGAGLASVVVDIGGASDHLPFDQIGVPMGGLFSGANEVKSEEQAGLFGGTAGLPADACYHLACDTAANIDRELLEQLARAAAWTLGRFADGEITLPEG
ncbi:MAG TPA: M28 family peptidase [Candidatus Limnocylindrales bacterium]|nr:M28 family peptidase [Candidatus Limnocylindrales bacterium]